MVVDEVEWDEANEKFNEICLADKAGLGIATLPYKVCQNHSLRKQK